MDGLRVSKFLQKPIGIKILLESGVIKRARVIDGETEGFMLEFEADGYEENIKLLHAKKPIYRIFKSIEGAIQFCRAELGMRGSIEVLA